MIKTGVELDRGAEFYAEVKKSQLANLRAQAKLFLESDPLRKVYHPDRRGLPKGTSVEVYSNSQGHTYRIEYQARVGTATVITCPSLWQLIDIPTPRRT